MARMVSVAALLALGLVACSSSGDSSPDGVAPTGTENALPGVAGSSGGPASSGAGSGGGPAEPGAGGAQGANGGEMMEVGMLQPGASLGGSGSTPTGGTGGGTPGEGMPGPGLSGLPARGTGGVARPAGAPGNLRVLDWAGFGSAVSYTFDDSNSSQINNYAALQGLGVPLTFYLQTGKMVESGNAIWAQAVTDGHELGNHTQSHQSNGANIGADTDAATEFIESRFGVSVYTMAAPNGSTAYGAIAATRFLINRGVNNQRILPNDNTDPFNLPCFIPATNSPVTAFNAQLDELRQNRAWKTVLVHGFNGGTDGAYQPVELQVFLDAVGYAKSFGDVWIDTLLEVAAYWRAQKTFTSVAPTTNGADTTWTWALPEHFPPGRFLRVTVDGGTLTQNGAALGWDDHGYYEVSLDAGSVTLSP